VSVAREATKNPAPGTKPPPPPPAREDEAAFRRQLAEVTAERDDSLAIAFAAQSRLAERVAQLERERDRLEALADQQAVEHMARLGLLAFLAAYDAWATSPEPCAGPLFDAMVAARSALPLAMPGDPAGGSDS
jgi:hypothetical protein